MVVPMLNAECCVFYIATVTNAGFSVSSWVRTYQHKVRVNVSDGLQVRMLTSAADRLVTNTQHYSEVWHACVCACIM